MTDDDDLIYPGAPKPPASTIDINDERTWPPHAEPELVGEDTCPADCVRCQLIVLREEQAFDNGPYNYQTGAFDDDDGFAMRERVRQLEKLVGPVQFPACALTACAYDQDVCIYCQKPRPGATP